MAAQRAESVRCVSVDVSVKKRKKPAHMQGWPEPGMGHTAYKYYTPYGI